MCNLEIITIEPLYAVRDKSTSDGSQIKYNINDKWYKIDNCGGEADSEALSSLLLECSNLPADKYVHYDKLIINGHTGCVSTDFRKNSEDEEFITLYRLYRNTHGNDLASVTSRMDYDDAIMYVIDFVKNAAGLDITSYLANMFYLDEIILNSDRHFNNYGLILSGDSFMEAPIFDNGKSLLTGQSVASTSIEETIKNVYSKSFSPSFHLNSSYLSEYRTVRIDKAKALKRISEYPDCLQKEVLLRQIDKCV